MTDDSRRRVPSTDVVLRDERLAEPQRRLGRELVLSVVREAQDRLRRGDGQPADLVSEVLLALPHQASTMRRVLNGTGVVLHTNLGRAPLSAAARDALVEASGYVDVEFDLDTGERARRGRGVLAALLQALPDAEDALVVNNGAAALLLCVTALSQGREVIWSRGEMVEIGDGFRLPDLVASTGALVREVGTTNRTVRDDYVSAISAETGCLLKVHPSNFRITGFTVSTSLAELAGLGPPLVVDVGSGLLSPDRMLPGEPDVSSCLRSGADLVIASADKLLGGPQAGIIAGRGALVARLRRHPVARAIRVDKLTLAALDATLRGPATPTAIAVRADGDALRARAQELARRIGGDAQVVPSEGAVGGGGAPEVTLRGWAISLPERLAGPLRTGDPPVVGRVVRGRCLIDLRCIEADDEEALLAAVLVCT